MGKPLNSEFAIAKSCIYFWGRDLVVYLDVLVWDFVLVKTKVQGMMSRSVEWR